MALEIQSFVRENLRRKKAAMKNMYICAIESWGCAVKLDNDVKVMN
jgi:hypothetical protein